MPSARLGLRAVRVHFPLMRLGLCLDCEECFEIGSDSCPACGSETWMPLARFLETARARRMVHLVESLQASTSHQADDAGNGADGAGSTHHFIIVARDREALYRHFAESLTGNPTISVVLDRRSGERRKHNGNGVLERRRSDRRWRTVDEQLRVLGWAVVRVDRVSPLR